MNSPQKITIKPVGYVKTDAIGDEVKDKTRTSQIIIRPEFLAALDGITEYSHIYIIFWMHKIPDEERFKMKVHPRGRTDLPLLGAFAVRTNHRPNPIGLTIVELIGIDENILTVRGLDAFNGTPVLDLKPYDNWDAIIDPRVPEWWLKLEQEKTKNHNT
jgi:tRNA-Thr(GGU) m(6)t(6)A37 methyltransferase TsaA